ncbi:NADH-quinone oxidoreductase subunit N [Candidatus Formimonas warabiya]|uniref:NADH-quinone oxidoreductase subunit N n=1 Tax=Formimonas warabiya TaxID=1761012 RepID=A0A3G1L068_FORW1|nr:NADH-quinone oxidoreductase subunit N [Candidatus Formimonas warabiya]ATW28039.1 NADH-quinone oxidoreductase subunit N [Candidatus Formimonas warabiya]
MTIDFSLLTIEILTAGLGLFLLVLAIIIPHQARKGLGYVTMLGLLGILIAAFNFQGLNTSLLNGFYLVDDFSAYLKILFLTAGILVVLGSMKYIESIGHLGEFYVTLVFALLGMMIMAGAGEFITLYVGLELMTISFAIMVAYRKTDSRCIEAGIKYIILAAFSSAVLLYGLSLVYGLTGTTLIPEIGTLLTGDQWSPALILGLVMVLAGFGFKISAVPFHMWSPDVYEGAPTPVTSFLAVGSKAASFAILARVFLLAFPGLTDHWTMLVAVLAAITIVAGNLIAIPQTNVKRMLAYSSIAQAGYILVGLVAATESGLKGMLFYSMLYVFATIGAFTVATNFYNETGSDDLQDYAGLSQRSPLMAAVMVVAMLSMAGIPPLAGFVGKLYLFSSIIENYLWLAVIAFIMSMVSVYYYLRVALVMYRDEPVNPSAIPVSSPVAATLLITMVVTFILGIYPEPLSHLANLAAKSFFLH